MTSSPIEAENGVIVGQESMRSKIRIAEINPNGSRISRAVLWRESLIGVSMGNKRRAA